MYRLLGLCLLLGCTSRSQEQPKAGLPEKAPQPPESVPALWGSLEGTVTFEGEPPVPRSLRTEIMSSMEQHCLKGPPEELLDPTWKVNKEHQGVANVVVYLEPPKGKELPIAKEDQVRDDVVTLDVHYCAYRPHVFVLFPAFRENGVLRPTGQQFKIVNTSVQAQMRSWYANPVANSSGGDLFRPGKELALDFKPQRGPIEFSLDWARSMRGYGWVFAHPYAAVSDENGRFCIPRVPARVEVCVFAWHEAKGNFHGGKEGVAQVLNQGPNLLSLKVAK